MKIIFICNKREKYIIQLQKHLQKEKKEVYILQINGFKLYKNEKEYKEYPPKGFLEFINKIPKIKVFSKIVNIKNILSKTGDSEHIILFYNNWTLKYLFPSFLKNSKKVSFYFDSSSQIKENEILFKKAKYLFFSNKILLKEFQKLYKTEFENKSFLCNKGINFKHINNIENEKENKVYCDIKEVKNIKEFINNLNKEYIYVFPMIGENFERRKELKKLLLGSNLHYEIKNSFLSEEENLSLIQNSKFVIALTNPQNSQTIQQALYLKKICIIYENFTNFFDEKEFHFVTIKELNELKNIWNEIEKYKMYKEENFKNIYALFSWENIAKNCKKILESE